MPRPAMPAWWAVSALKLRLAIASAAVASALDELGEDAPLNDLVRVALRKAAG